MINLWVSACEELSRVSFQRIPLSTLFALHSAAAVCWPSAAAVWGDAAADTAAAAGSPAAAAGFFPAPAPKPARALVMRAAPVLAGAAAGAAEEAGLAAGAGGAGLLLTFPAVNAATAELTAAGAALSTINLVKAWK